MAKMQICVVVSEFNYDITQMMLQRALEHAKFLEIDVKEVIHTPGVYEIPLVVKKLIKKRDVDGIVALGAVIEGETEHDDVIMQHVARKLMDLAIEYEKPIGFGITGPGMTRLQAQERIDNAKYAVETVLKIHKSMK